MTETVRIWLIETAGGAMLGSTSLVFSQRRLLIGGSHELS